MSSSSTICRWSTPFLLDIDDKETYESRDPYALIILNQPFSVTLLVRLWNACKWHVCADGGANRLYDTLQSAASTLISQDFLPDRIKGDLDSLRPDVREYYASLGVPIIQDSDQNSTDLMKCMIEVGKMEVAQESTKQMSIILLGGLGGRIDHTIHTLCFLHRLRKKRERSFAITDDNVGWVLGEGEHIIEINSRVLGPTCGLLPVGIASSTITTSGLKWNLDKAVSSFDGFVSTSNAVVDREVYVSTSSPIFWCIEINWR